MVESIAGLANATRANADVAQPAKRRESTQEMGDRFMELLVAQIQNQDPLNPMDNAQVTSQIAQINTVSGINDLNESLGQINGQIESSQRLQASALIGRQVLVPGSDIAVGSDGTAMPFGVELEGPAESLSLTIHDDMGNVLHESTIENVAAGTRSFAWDGLDAAEQPVDPGRYRVTVAAVDGEGNPVGTRGLTSAQVNGVMVGEGGPKLDLGLLGAVDLEAVRQILE